MDPENPFREGDVLAGKYRLLGLLGQGGMGAVYSAMHLGLGQPVAVKLLRADRCETRDAVSRFLAEARAMARLRGDHVAKVLDVDTLETSLPFFVMELLHGENLQQMIALKGALPRPEAVDLILQACQAVAEAHREGIVHRDLKPANLFLARDVYAERTLKVLDFGISKLLPSAAIQGVGLTDSRTLVGSPVYMSPEQMRSARDVDHRTDIWSLGTVLFELLTGRPVWVGENLADLCAQIARDPAPDLCALMPNLPTELSAVATRCLHKDPAQRFQQVSDLALALMPFGSPRGQQTVVRMLALLGMSGDSSLQTACSPVHSANVRPLTQISTTEGTSATRRWRENPWRFPRSGQPWLMPVAAAAVGTAIGLLFPRSAPVHSSTTPANGSASSRSVLPPAAAIDIAREPATVTSTPASVTSTPASVTSTPASAVSAVPDRRPHFTMAFARPKATPQPTSPTSTAALDPMSIRK